jgi:hypothetical protein
MLVSHVSLSLIGVHQLLSYSAMILSSVNASFSCSFIVAFNHAKMPKLFSTADTPYKILEVRFSLSCRSSCLCDVYSTCLLLQQWWEVTSMNAKSECIWYLRNLRACMLSLPLFFDPFGSYFLNKRLQCTFLKCLKVSVWNAWYGFNSHRKSFSGVLDLPLQIVVMPTPENYQWQIVESYYTCTFQPAAGWNLCSNVLLQVNWAGSAYWPGSTTDGRVFETTSKVSFHFFVFCLSSVHELDLSRGHCSDMHPRKVTKK